jgi:hypothetical protein
MQNNINTNGGIELSVPQRNCSNPTLLSPVRITTSQIGGCIFENTNGRPEGRPFDETELFD